MELPRNSSARLGSDTYNTRPSDDLVPDITVTVGPDDKPLRVVVGPDETTAAWYAEPLPTALDDCMYQPKPLLAADVPFVRDVAAAVKDPAMGMLSVIYHGGSATLWR